MSESKVMHQQAKRKGIWKDFFAMLKMVKMPWTLLITYIIWQMIQTKIILAVPQVNGNFFAGDASVKSVTMFIGIELLVTVVCQIGLYMNHIIRYQLNRNLRNELWGKILKVKPVYYDSVSPNTLLSRITSDSESMNEFLMDIILGIFSSVYTLSLTIYEMSTISIKAGLMLLAFAPLSCITALIMGRLTHYFQNNIKFKMSNLTNYLSDLIGSLPLLKAHNCQNYELERGKKINDEYYRSQVKNNFFTLFGNFVGQLTGMAPEVVIFLIGIQYLKDGTFTVEAWYVFYIYAGTFIGFFNQICSAWQQTKGIQGRMNKIIEVLSTESEGIEQYVDEIIESGDINVEHVSFGYGEQPVLQDVSFVIPENKTTAVIGYSGTGKSTILKLLERVYEPNTGRIMMHGKNIENTNIVNYRNLLAFLMQNSPMMSGTVRENILYGIKKTVSDEEILTACEMTNLKDFIESVGLDYMIEPFGENLSGGQRQKLALARAILSDKPYLLLDEPTSSIDIPSRTDICNTLESLKGKKTIAVVTHDQQIVERADHIVVVNKDHSVSSGNHRDMLLLNEFYRNFVNAKEAEYGKE